METLLAALEGDHPLALHDTPPAFHFAGQDLDDPLRVQAMAGLGKEHGMTDQGRQAGLHRPGRIAGEDLHLHIVPAADVQHPLIVLEDSSVS